MELLMPDEIKTIYDLLRISQSTLGVHQSSTFPFSTAESVLALPVPNSPIEDAVFKPLKEKQNTKSDKKAKPDKAQAAPLVQNQPFVQAEAAPRRASFVMSDLIKYPLIFVIAFGCFYLILNFGAFYAKFQAKIEPVAQEPQTQGIVLGVATDEFKAWIGKYFYSANNPDALSPNNDFDHDGLTNYEEFLLRSNPIKKDTDEDGYGDGREVLNGYNPLYSGALTSKQQELMSEWDMQAINDRISYFVTTSLPTGPAQPSNLPAINYDLDVSGELKIPRLGLTAPLIWSQSPDRFTDDLERGVIHYPGTSLPGQAGVAYVSGHSSNYIWRSQDFAHVFARLDEMKVGDEFFLTVSTREGKKQALRYLVVSSEQYQPDDQAQFISPDDQNSYVNLSTCWPIGTIARRLVVSGKLVGI